MAHADRPCGMCDVRLRFCSPEPKFYFPHNPNRTLTSSTMSIALFCVMVLVMGNIEPSGLDMGLDSFQRGGIAKKVAKSGAPRAKLDDLLSVVPPTIDTPRADATTTHHSRLQAAGGEAMVPSLPLVAPIPVDSVEAFHHRRSDTSGRSTPERPATFSWILLSLFPIGVCLLGTVLTIIACRSGLRRQGSRNAPSRQKIRSLPIAGGGSRTPPPRVPIPTRHSPSSISSLSSSMYSSSAASSFSRRTHTLAGSFIGSVRAISAVVSRHIGRALGSTRTAVLRDADTRSHGSNSFNSDLEEDAWSMYRTDSGVPYFYNAITNRTSWEAPSKVMLAVPSLSPPVGADSSPRPFS